MSSTPPLTNVRQVNTSKNNNTEELTKVLEKVLKTLTNIDAINNTMLNRMTDEFDELKTLVTTQVQVGGKRKTVSRCSCFFAIQILIVLIGIVWLSYTYFKLYG